MSDQVHASNQGFLDSEWRIMTQLLRHRKGGRLFYEAKLLNSQWSATIHYLHDVRPATDFHPLMEAPFASFGSLHLAAGGFYREAVAALRTLVDLALWEWKQSLEPTKLTRFEFGEDVDALIDLPIVWRYREAVTSRVRDRVHADSLLRPVSPETILGLRPKLNEAVHAGPDTWDVKFHDDGVPLPRYSSDGLRRWQLIYCDCLRVVAVWCNLIFPDLMRWSMQEPLETSGGTHAVWWNPVLDEVQRDIFASFHP